MASSIAAHTDGPAEIRDSCGSPAAAKTHPAIAALSLKLAPVPDRDFLTKFALAANDALKADYFSIMCLNPYSNIIRAVRFVNNGKIDGDHPPTYTLSGTPCADLSQGGVCVYKDNVADSFPKDRFVHKHGIRGFAGAMLVSSKGDPLGVFVALKKTPIEDETLARAVMTHFQGRVAAALEAAQTQDRYSVVAAETTEGVWEWDVLTGGTTLSENMQTLLGYVAKGPHDLSTIESAIHPDDRNTHVEALRNHLNNHTPYDVKFRMRGRNGVYRWFRSRGKAVCGAGGRPVRMIGSFSDIHDLVIGAQRDGLHA
jgi:PAS domain S-box-containing protein